MIDSNLPEESIPKSFVTAVKDRLSHPVAGVFAIAWVFFNWKLLFTLAVSSSPAEARINAALAYTNWNLGLNLPLFTTAVYLLGTPWLQVLVARYNGYVTRKQAEREYEDKLAQMTRNEDLVTRALYTKEPGLKSQQQAKVRLEKELQDLGRRKMELETGIREIGELAAMPWQSFIQAQSNLKEFSQKDSVRVNLKNIHEQISRVKEVEAQLRNRFPEEYPK